MNRQESKKQNRVWLFVSVLSVLGYLVLLALRHDFWYDLNDDVMIKNITSGIYTGTPEFHNIQMQYPLSLILALLYRIANRIPWYALFLVGTQALSIIFILYRTSAMFPNRKTKIAGFTATAAILFLLLTKHMVIYQYTVSCAFLSGAAAFLLLTGSDSDAKKEGGETSVLTANNMTVVMLLLLSFLIRSEMMLLTFPMVLVALLFRFVYTCSADIGIANKPRIINVFKKYLTLLITFIIVLILAVILNGVGYASSGWKTFNAFFDARTELYDFNAIPPYEGNESFYQEIGLDGSSQKLLENYNFGLDEEIDADVLTKIAEYSKEQNKMRTGAVSVRLKKAFSEYVRRVGHPLSADEDETDVFWKMTVTVIYLLVLLAGRNLHILWKLILLFACRTTLWMYIIYRNRVPIRITHSLYFVELMVLAALLFLEARPFLRKESEGEKKTGKGYMITLAFSITAVLLFLITLPKQDILYKQEEELRLRYSQPYDILFTYMEEHPDEFYFIDVYSWVEYTERLFGKPYFNGDSYLKKQTQPGMNYDLMGGWATFSPTAHKKISALGAASMQEALLEEGVYFVQEAASDLAWLETYYRETGYDIVVEHVNVIGEFGIYRLMPR